MILAILGRQPELGIAELEAVCGPEATRWFSSHTATAEVDDIRIEALGGSQKLGRVVIESTTSNWSELSKKIAQYYSQQWSSHEGKITLGLSAYGFNVSPREVQKTGLVLKQRLKKSGVSLRLVPNTEPALSSATSHHNKLGLSANKVELLIVRGQNNQVLIAESLGAQNITALARRDQGRPKRDAFVGMLPPKLALMMVNLAAGRMVDGRWNMVDGKSPNANSQMPIANDQTPSTTNHLPTTASPLPPPRLLDPFCGTGVVLQEAGLLGYDVYGTDLAEKMIDYSRQNLDWLQQSHRTKFNYDLKPADAIEAGWTGPIDAVATETYLGQPFSAIPSPAKLTQVKRNCNYILSQFLTNLADQIKPGTPLCVAVPAWRLRDNEDRFSHLPLIEELDRLGYRQFEFNNIEPRDLLYHRPDQVVARQLLVLVKK